MPDADPPLPSLVRRLRDGFERIAAVLRADQWSAAAAHGLNPTQAQFLRFVAGRGAGGARIREIAEQFGVSQPTVTDSINALQAKELVAKAPDASDARAVVVRLTRRGAKAVAAMGETSGAAEAALAQLPVAEQAELLRLQVKTIRLMQQAGAIPVQRMCVSCRYFQPYVHSDAARPHHCVFVDAAFGDADLRLDCADHEIAEPSVQAATWRTFHEGRLRAPPGNT